MVYMLELEKTGGYSKSTWEEIFMLMTAVVTTKRILVQFFPQLQRQTLNQICLYPSNVVKDVYIHRVVNLIILGVFIHLLFFSDMQISLLVLTYYLC
jgi:hypothetical protein